MEKTVTQPQHRTRQGNLVIPLDEPRCYDWICRTVVSGTSGTVYTGESGKVYYLRQAMYSELSGNNGLVQIFTDDYVGHGSSSGALHTPIPIEPNTAVSYDACPCAVGPICPQSGTANAHIYIHDLAGGGGPQFNGEVCLYLTVDPQVFE